MSMRMIRIVYDGETVRLDVDGSEIFCQRTDTTFDVEVTRRAVEMATEAETVAFMDGDTE